MSLAAQHVSFVKNTMGMGFETMRAEYNGSMHLLTVTLTKYIKNKFNFVQAYMVHVKTLVKASFHYMYVYIN